MTTFDRSQSEDLAGNNAGPQRENPYEHNVMTILAARREEREHFLDVSRQWHKLLPEVVSNARLETPKERRSRGSGYSFKWPEHPGTCRYNFGDYDCDCHLFEHIVCEFSGGDQVPPTFVEAHEVMDKRFERLEEMSSAIPSFAKFLRTLNRKYEGDWVAVPELDLRGDFRAYGRWSTWGNLPKNRWQFWLRPRRFFTAEDAKHFGRQPYPGRYEPFTERLYTFETKESAIGFAEDVFSHLKQHRELWLLIWVEGLELPSFLK